MSAATLRRKTISAGALMHLSRLLNPQRFPLRNLCQRRSQHSTAASSSLPRIAQPSLWKAIIPRFIRDRAWKTAPTGEKKPTNPASYFIWIYLFIGSQAIRIISVQNEFKTFMRKSDVKIDLLREVIEKLKKGEEVDVEKALGTGDEAQELEWEEAIKEIEMEDRLWSTSRQKKKEEQARKEAEAQDASPVREVGGNLEKSTQDQTSDERRPGFY